MTAARKAAIIILILLLAVCLLRGQIKPNSLEKLPGQALLLRPYQNPCTFHQLGAFCVGGAVEGRTPAELNKTITMNTSKISGYRYNVKTIKIRDLRAAKVYGRAGALGQAKPRPGFLRDTNTNKNNRERSSYNRLLTISWAFHENLLLLFGNTRGRERWRWPLPVSFPRRNPLVDNQLFDTLEIRQTEIFLWISGLTITFKGWQGWNAHLNVSFIDTTVSKEAGAFSLPVAPGLNCLILSIFKAPSLNINTPGSVYQAWETCMVKGVDRSGFFSGPGQG